MSGEQYNGYKNRETWAVNLWLGNDEGFYNDIRDQVIGVMERKWDETRETCSKEEYGDLQSDLADCIKEYVEGLMEHRKDNETIMSMFDDIGSLWRVDWDEIAEYWLCDDVKIVEKSNEYYIQVAIDHYGSEIRDNSREDKIEMGKELDK